MAKQNISQQVIFEILTREIESLKKATSDIHAVAPEINQQLKELRNYRDHGFVAKVDMKPFEALEYRLKSSLDRFKVLPNWTIFFLFAVTISFMFALGVIYYQYWTIQEVKSENRRIGNAYVELLEVQKGEKRTPNSRR
jgi:hypothetical protein